MGSIKGDGLLERVVPAGTPTASPQGCKVWSCNEWDPLEEVVVGNPFNARFPHPDKSTQVAEYPDRSLEEIPCGPFPQKIIEEAEEDLLEFIIGKRGRCSPSEVETLDALLVENAA